MRILLDECVPKRLKRDLANKHAALQPLINEVLSVLTALAPGQVVRVGA